MPDTTKPAPVRAMLILVLVLTAIVGGCVAAVDACSPGHCETQACRCLRGSDAACRVLMLDCGDWTPPRDLYERCAR